MTYGCFNRAPLKEMAFVQDGWNIQRRLGEKSFGQVGRMISIPDPMTKTCQYQADDKYGDKGCIGCKWKEAHDAR